MKRRCCKLIQATTVAKNGSNQRKKKRGKGKSR